MEKSKLNTLQQSWLLELFVKGSSARHAAELVGINQSSANYYFERLRKIIRNNTLLDSGVNNKLTKLKSYLEDIDPIIKNSTPVFGVVSKVMIETVMFTGTEMDKLLLLLLSKDDIDALFYNTSDQNYHTYDISKFECFCIGDNYQQGECNANIEEFWQFTKNNLSKFNGIPAKNFDLYLKESAWRYNNRESERQVSQLNRWINYN